MDLVRPQRNSTIFELGPKERLRMRKELHEEAVKKSRKASFLKNQAKWTNDSSFVAMGAQHIQETDKYLMSKLATISVIILYVWPKIIHNFIIPAILPESVLEAFNRFNVK